MGRPARRGLAGRAHGPAVAARRDNAASAASVADLVLLPCRPSGRLDVSGQSRRWDVEAVADTATRVRTVAAPSVIAMLNACAPRLQSADEVTGALAGQGGVERRSPPWQPLSTQPRRSTWARSATLDRLSAALSAAHQRLSGAWSGSIDAPTGPRGPSCRPQTGSGAASRTAGSPPTACQPARADRPTSARIRAVSALAAGAVGDGPRVQIMGGTVPGGPGRLGTPGTQRRRALQDLSSQRRSGPLRSPWRASGSYG